MHERRRSSPAVLALLGAALAMTLVLAGCTGDDPEPKMPESTSSAPTPTDEPTETESPEAQESPEDFIRRWAQVNTEMQNSGRVAEYIAMSSPCEACVQTAKRIRGFYDAGGFVQTEGWKINRIERKAGLGPDVYDLYIRSASTRYKTGAGEPVEALPGGDIVMRVRLTRAEPLKVRDLTQVPS